ncbi:MAG: holo-ACP synthase [Dehalococcoidales bacterium]|nr:holo-ACP synthase [Dehalococcoidales bacterium]
MQYVGVDIVEIARIQTLINRWGQTFLKRVYTPSELKLYRNTSSLAARFAAKEAVLKALGACDNGISWQDIEILAELNGKPSVNLMGKAKLHADESAIRKLNISLSHSKEYAVAFVVGETA